MVIRLVKHKDQIALVTMPPGTVSARRIVRPEITRTISLARPTKRHLSFAAEAVYDIAKRLAIAAVKEGRWQGTPLC
jgi:hypothetical protein